MLPWVGGPRFSEHIPAVGVGHDMPGQPPQRRLACTFTDFAAVAVGLERHGLRADPAAQREGQHGDHGDGHEHQQQHAAAGVTVRYAIGRTAAHGVALVSTHGREMCLAPGRGCNRTRCGALVATAHSAVQASSLSPGTGSA